MINPTGIILDFIAGLASAINETKSFNIFGTFNPYSFVTFFSFSPLSLSPISMHHEFKTKIHKRQVVHGTVELVCSLVRSIQTKVDIIAKGRGTAF